MTTRVSELANGLKIATRSMPHATTLSVGIWVNAGTRDEGDREQGIAHMLEHMAFKGTKRRDAQAIATEVENVGGFMNAHTSREETAYYLRLLPEHLDLGVDILADILTESTLPELEIERVQFPIQVRSIRSEYQQEYQRQDQDALAIAANNRRFLHGLYGHS